MAVGANGSVWGINSSQQIFQFSGPTRPFQTASVVPGSLTQVFVGVDGTVWGLDYFTVEWFNPGTQTFEAVPGAPDLYQLSVSARGEVWGVDGMGGIYRYDSDTGSWINVPGELNEVKVAADHSVWGINTMAQIYTYDATQATWVYVPGWLSGLWLGADGSVWGINGLSQTWYWNSQSHSWNNVPGSLEVMAVGNAATVWGINQNNQVYRYNPTKQLWDYVPVTFALPAISAAFDGSVWGADLQWNLRQWDPVTQTFNSFPVRGTGSPYTPPTGFSVSVGNAVAVWAVSPAQIVYSWF
jgi:hypothetical protein